MDSVDAYLTRKYVANEYTCFDFVREVWRDITGVDIGVMQRPKMDKEGIAGNWEHVCHKWRRLDALVSPCVVLFQRPRTIPHVGIYIRGKVLHLPANGNVRFEDIAVAKNGFSKLSYYA